MKMKMLLWMAAAVLLLSPPVLWAAPGDPGTGLATTNHDFTDAANYTTSTPVGLCTFCHTPHKAQHTALLWNHSDTSNTFSWTDNTKTAAGTSLPTFTKTWNGPTPKCLSCHDGSVAVGDVAWFDEKAQLITTTSVTPGILDASGKIIDTSHQVGVGGSMNGNHPVVVPYPGVGSKHYAGGNSGTSIVTAEWQGDPTALGVVLYKASDNTLAASINRVTNSPVGADNLGVECASCHDPHNKLTVDAKFLRGMMTGNDTNYLCLKCHIK
ncbi:MAG: cytochrome c3 family protein [Candidatus Binatia bacterium]